MVAQLRELRRSEEELMSEQLSALMKLSVKVSANLLRR